MSRIHTPAIETATGATAELYGNIKKAVGMVPNTYAAIGALTPAGLGAILGADGALAAGTLSKQDQEVIKLLVSHLTGCDYCETAHFMLGKMTGLSVEVLQNVRAGRPTGDVKRDALISFVTLLIKTSGTVSQQDFAAIKAAGYTDVQLAEISLAISVIMFTNLFNRVNDTTIDFPAIPAAV
ncbi:carboxymuconolactone decarboxylase family protein [Pseudomonas plecoglossicida]|jgi:uncharacterized peroxidase-related enzyme|uniref:Carboxymuconolactone decarboxylase family protein n=2 Tax=Pseudomonas TaxID=286 RepID=A0A2A3LWD0_PSEDL|nr:MULTISPECIES: carboxymuconolactone decarboxylase family protein [Pseudomonas]TXG95824.1 MAG: carboxymuconolactone decarboxylase family protein [Nevskiaceae bacterium]GJB83397.1 alkyl hydroperoxide reductase AhpD [Aeromonas caviae]HBO8767073.1 carboxymuconolactone decarboxylase family protein [Pseudomonas aeruginosa]EKT4484811.1 carboxymuconolactone decarboxylase family protein [Pseudomonas putida]EKT4528418.1 carboxymuconolactone decarboxylase family protein [Pseudomonas putida]